jgi:hypothetical protein
MTIETKYSPGDKVWAIVENRAQCLRVDSVAVSTLTETFDEIEQYFVNIKS